MPPPVITDETGRTLVGLLTTSEEISTDGREIIVFNCLLNTFLSKQLKTHKENLRGLGSRTDKIFWIRSCRYPMKTRSVRYDLSICFLDKSYQLQYKMILFLEHLKKEGLSQLSDVAVATQTNDQESWSPKSRYPFEPIRSGVCLSVALEFVQCDHKRKEIFERENTIIHQLNLNKGKKYYGEKKMSLKKTLNHLMY